MLMITFIDYKSGVVKLQYADLSYWDSVAEYDHLTSLKHYILR